MTKSRIKSSTTLIVVLSVLLVLSLAATVTLAYFSATKKLTGTLNFAGAVTLEAYADGTGTSPASEWFSGNDLASDQTIPTLGVKASATSGTLQYYIAIYVTVTGTGAPGSVTYATTPVAGQSYAWTDLSGQDGWKVLTNAGDPVAVAANTYVGCTEQMTVTATAGAKVSGEFRAVTVTSDSTSEEAEADLAEVITETSWA